MNSSFKCPGCDWKLRNEEVDGTLNYRCTIYGNLYQLSDLRNQQTQNPEFYKNQEKEILKSRDVAPNQNTPDFFQLEDIERFSWDWFKALAGIKLEEENSDSSQAPYISLLYILICVSFYFFPKAAGDFALNPHNLFQKGGFNLLGYSFVHASLSHLVGNIIFLYPFITKVEEKLGHLNTLGFIIASATGGALMHVAFDHRGLPLVGASAVCFSYIVYYGLAFTNNHIRITEHRYWYYSFWPSYAKRSITAGGFALTYIILGLIGVIGQRDGTTLTSHLGHIGGAMVAIIVYFITVDESEKQN